MSMAQPGLTTLSTGPRHWFKLVTRLRKVDFEDTSN